jgi:hypothetical protein
MNNSTTIPNLFELGQQNFEKFKTEFAAYGLDINPALELRPGSGLLCYYNLTDGHIYLAVPDLVGPTGKLQALIFRSMLGCQSNEELRQFFQLFIPYVIAHEMTHHLRHRCGLFGENLWEEEQLANKMAVAVVKHRLSPAEKSQAKKFLQQANQTLAAHIKAKNIAVDSYYSPLHALNVSGQLNVADFEAAELVKTALGLSETELLEDSGQISDDMVSRLEQRQELIDEINRQYTADQIKYIYYHVGWLTLDLTSRETEYVDEFARIYLNRPVNLLPAILPDQPPPTALAVQACYQAHLETKSQPTAARFFYKRYRALLLACLQSVPLATQAHTERLRREATLLLESWTDSGIDTLNYLAHLAPPELRPLFPHLIRDNPPALPDLAAALPTQTDRRLWQHAAHTTPDEAAANTLYRLEILDKTAVYRPLPAALMLELARLFSLVKFTPGESVIWQGEFNDDVYFLISGKLEALVNQNGQTEPVGQINPGEMFGEIAFFTEDARYATVRAVEPSQCLVLTDADLQIFAYQHPTILMQMAGVLAKRLADIYHIRRRETL